MDLNIRSTIAEGLKKVEALDPRQFPFVVSLAINRTLKRSNDRIKEIMPTKFANPTPYTKNATTGQYSNKETLRGHEKLKDIKGANIPQNAYLNAQVRGGARSVKRFEAALQAAGAMPKGLYAVPGGSVRLNQYGNIPTGTINSILAFFRNNPEAIQGKEQPAKRKKRPAQYFAILEQRGRLPAGIYQRQSNGIKLLIAYVKEPTYTKRLPFYEEAEAVAKQYFEEELRKAAEHAMRTAKPPSTMADYLQPFHFFTN